MIAVGEMKRGGENIFFSALGKAAISMKKIHKALSFANKSTINDYKILMSHLLDKQNPF